MGCKTASKQWVITFEACRCKLQVVALYLHMTVQHVSDWKHCDPIKRGACLRAAKAILYSGAMQMYHRLHLC